MATRYQIISTKDLPLATITAINDGWIAVTGSWSYASASTITIPSDGTTVYQKGMPIRWKQGGTYKYGNIAAIASTLMTIFVNTDFVVDNAAITDMYYSVSPTPFGFPTWFSRTTTGIMSGSGGSAGTYAQTNAVATYRVFGASVIESVRLYITNVGSWSGDVRLAGVVTASSAESPAPLGGGIWQIGAAPSGSKGMPYPNASSAIINFVSQVAAANLQWSAVAANDDVYVRGEYRY